MSEFCTIVTVLATAIVAIVTLVQARHARFEAARARAATVRSEVNALQVRYFSTEMHRALVLLGESELPNDLKQWAEDRRVEGSEAHQLDMARRLVKGFFWGHAELELKGLLEPEVRDQLLAFTGVELLTSRVEPLDRELEWTKNDRDVFQVFANWRVERKKRQLDFRELKK